MLIIYFLCLCLCLCLLLFVVVKVVVKVVVCVETIHQREIEWREIAVMKFDSKKKRKKTERTETRVFSLFRTNNHFRTRTERHVLHNKQQHTRRRNDQLSVHVSLILRRGGVPDVRFDESHRS